MYGELLTEFEDLPVFDFNQAGDWQGPDNAYRVAEGWDDKVSIAQRLELLVQQPSAAELTALIIGAWTEAGGGETGSTAYDKLRELAPRLPALKSLFLGEMTYEQCEISWITQSDVSPVLQAFPRLESLRIRGGNGLKFSRIRHEHLKTLAAETGGLPASAIRQILLCEFPSLEHLELLLGESNYGFDGSVEDLQPLLAGKHFPRLKFLGLMNSEIANEIAAVVVNSPLVRRIETLDLSMGNLDDEGVRSLMQLRDNPSLTLLNISHHYAAAKTVEELTRAVRCQVVAHDRQDPDDEWRPILHAE